MNRREIDEVTNRARAIVITIARRYGLDPQQHPHIAELLEMIAILRAMAAPDRMDDSAEGR